MYSYTNVMRVVADSEAGGKPSKEDIWRMYMEKKQTVAEISETTGLSASTIKRRLAEVKLKWEQPRISGRGVVHMDATYFTRNKGILLAVESGTGRVLYMEHISHERLADYKRAVDHISNNGYEITGLVVDGFKGLTREFSQFKIQMCQYHLVAKVRTQLTKNPQLTAGRELLNLVYGLKDMDKDSFTNEFHAWKREWKDFLNEKTVDEKEGRAFFTHARLRSAVASIARSLPYLFTHEEVEGMPPTNNQVEGTFSYLKRILRAHPGMSEQNRDRLVDGFFLAYAELHNHNTKGDGL